MGCKEKKPGVFRLQIVRGLFLIARGSGNCPRSIISSNASKMHLALVIGVSPIRVAKTITFFQVSAIVQFLMLAIR